MTDVPDLNPRTPKELLDAGRQLALKSDVWSDMSIEQIVQKIKDFFGFDIPNWEQLTANFAELRQAIDGTYTGTNPALLAIQGTIGVLRRLAAGTIEPWRLPLIPLSHIGEASPNLLENGSFDGPNPIEETEGWTLDTAVGRTSPGSARTFGNGTRRVLLSNVVLCTPDQKFDIGGHVTWSMLTGGGTGSFKLSAVAYDDTESVVEEKVIAQIDSPSGAQAWTAMLGQYTVPAGAVKIRVQVEVAATVTGGTINFDDLSVVKRGTLPQNFITNLIPDLANLGDWITQLVQQGLGALGIPIMGGLLDQILDFADGLDDWMTDTDATASGLDDLLGGLLSNPESVIGSLPQSSVSGLMGSLASLLPKTDHQALLNRLGGGSGTVVGQLPVLGDIIGAVTDGAQGGNLTSGNPLTDLWNNMFGLHQAAQSALTSAAAANTQLAAQQQDTESGDAGNSYTTTFGGTNEAALNGPWTSSDVVIKNGYAGLRDATTTNGSNYLAKTSNTASRDDFVVAVVLGDQGDAANTRIVTRADLNFTMGVYVTINKSGLAIGRWTNGGGTLTQWASVSVNVSGGAAVRVRAVGNQYTVFLNGVDALSYTDTGAAAPFGPAYRSAGFTLGTDTGFFGYRYYSFRLASFMLADYNPPGASVTASWRLSRSSATTVNFASDLWASSSSALVAGYLTASENAAAVTVTDLGRGQVKINQAGHYWMQFNSRGTYYNNSSDPPSTANLGEVGWVLLVNGTVATGHITPGVPYLMFLNVNDVVAPGVMFATSFYGTNYSYLRGLNGPASFTGYRLGA